MPAIRTTPPRPLDVAAAFPQLAPLARPALRLHPRPGSPSPYESSVGGPLLWPSRQPWPYCDKWHEGPESPLVPVAQLYVRDIPLLRPPGRDDVLQVLWCPAEHPPEYKPPTSLFWQTSADVTDILDAPPEPTEVEFDQYVPEPCVLAPERITEYPHFLELDKEVQQQLADRGAWQAAGVDVDDSYAAAPEEFYSNELSLAPGWKVGGWAPWGLTDPVPRFCIACGAAMVPLLTIPSNEWDSTNRGWIPFEDPATAVPGNRNASNPSGVQIASGHRQQLYVCPRGPSPGHPHTDLMQ